MTKKYLNHDYEVTKKYLPKILKHTVSVTQYLSNAEHVKLKVIKEIPLKISKTQGTMNDSDYLW